MKKRTLSVVISLCLMITMLLSVPVSAAGTVALNKTEFTINEKGKATISGLTQEEIDNGAWLGISPEGEKYENTYNDIYVSDLPANNIWEFTAPSKLGKYEVRLMDADYNLIAKTAFTVNAAKAKDGDVKLSKTEAKLNEPMTVTVNGLTKGQIDEGAWLGISKYDEKLQNTYNNSYIHDLDINNTYKFNAPTSFGRYEVRVFSDYSDDYEASFFGKAEFIVTSSKAKPGDIVLSKISVYPEEKMTVSVKGLTDGEIKEGAWLGIAKYDEKLQNTYNDSYISDLNMNNIYEFKAPTAPGRYEVRVFCKYPLEDAEFEYGMFGRAEFTVNAAPAGQIGQGYEGLSNWAVTEVNNAVKENLITEKVMTKFPESITREEFCELAVLLYEKMTGAKAAAATSNPFNDTTNPEIIKAYSLGIVGGVGGGKFAPNDKVTRQDLSLMLLRTLKAAKPSAVTTDIQFKNKFQDEKEIGSWAYEAVKFFNSHDIIRGNEQNGIFHISPKGNTTREQAIALVLRIYNTFSK